MQKKSKKKSTASDELPVFVTLADVDVDVFPSTSICDDIPSQECYIAAERSVEENQQCETNDAAENNTGEQQAPGTDLEIYTY